MAGGYKSSLHCYTNSTRTHEACAEKNRQDALDVNQHCQREGASKETMLHAFLADKSPANWQLYRMAKKEAKKAVAAAKASRFEDLYRKLDTRKRERDLYKLARTRDRQTQDVVKFVGINDEEGNLITDRKKVAER
ncbi:hypothetical protein Y032_0364g3554 [Ancylostoma ceylanicum]|uniref:Uncharacterized protein n=1 Tax=Ancylostoma ceylanicum TaxID=53326 RepID=A0A016RV84_9BILA|nr:hypothetical protein Y032_0364g3554 [Ancylostoma ceylanicum]